MNELIYLDHAAATPCDPGVFEAMRPYFSERFYNPSSPYLPAVEVRREYEAAKAAIAAVIGVKKDELVITAGATESINLAFSVAAETDHVVTTAIEHHAVLEAAKRRSHTLVQPTPKGKITPEAIKAALTPDTVLVSVAIANNELGTIQPIAKIAAVIEVERKRRHEANESMPLYLHADGSQGMGQLEMHAPRLGLDMLTLNAGKVYGPKQVGLLWAKSDVVLSSAIVGGGQERGLRSGTENVAGTVGFAAALARIEKGKTEETKRLGKLRDELQQSLETALPGAVISGDQKHRLASHLHISFPGLDGERLVFRLESRGVLVATGSACAANKGTRSHVLTAIGLDERTADGSLRLSLGKLIDEERCAKAAEILIEEIRAEYERVKR